MECAAYEVSKLIHPQSESQFLSMLVVLVNVALVGLPDQIPMDFFFKWMVPLTILLLK